MSEPSHEIRRINWSECLPATLIFRTFKLALHPGKLALALAAVLFTGFWGWTLDSLWSDTHLPAHGEVSAYWQVPDIGSWRGGAWASRPAQIEFACRSVGVEFDREHISKEPRDAMKKLLNRIEEKHQATIDTIKNAPENDKLNEKELAAKIADSSRAYRLAYEQVWELKPVGIFRGFTSYQAKVARQAVDAARGLNFANGFNEVLTARTAGSSLRSDMGMMQGNDILLPVRTGPDGLGVVSCAILGLRGIQWMVVEHSLFAILFGLPALFIWGLFGGAVCRMAALNVARDERISLSMALEFARRKCVQFFTAPLLPIFLVVGIGVFLVLGGLVTAIPGIGELLGGATAGLALVAGFLMAVIVVGAVAGGALMWPTIAVEGSDSFDALSRSYGYIYPRPWHAAFYAALAAVYGAICYLFVRFFVLVALKAARFFVALGLGWTSRPGTGNSAATKIDTLWAAPSFDTLFPSPSLIGMESWDGAGAFLISVWLILLAGLLCAFVASFALTASTIIYFLLRRQVDATDIEDVYLESEDEEDLMVAAMPPPADAPSPVEVTIPANGGEQPLASPAGSSPESGGELADTPGAEPAPPLGPGDNHPSEEQNQ